MLVQLLPDDATRVEAARALANLAAAGGQEHRQAVAAAGAIPSLVRCLQADDAAAEDAARALAVLAAHSPEHALAVEAAGAVPMLRRLDETSRDEDSERYAGVALRAITSAQAQQTAPGAAQPPPAATTPARPAAARVCAAHGCGATSGLRRCGACRTVRYCSEACSHSHWRQHKAECRRLQAARAQAAGEGEAAAQQP